LIDTTARQTATGAEVHLQRRINNFLVPIFQFGMFSNDDLEVHPGPQFTFNGRVHANGNLYVSGTTTFLSKVTTANELVVDVLRNGSTHDQAMNIKVGATMVPLTMGSATSGPNFSGATSGNRGFFPGSPNGSANASWDTASVAAASGVANRFGGQVLTRSTGGVPLLLPMQLEGARASADCPVILRSGEARYGENHAVLIDDQEIQLPIRRVPTMQGVYFRSSHSHARWERQQYAECSRRRPRPVANQ
jgi:hypothetical protein